MADDANATSEILEYQDLMAGYNARTNRLLPVLTKYERTMVLATRAEQLMRGAVPLVERMPGEKPHEIALRELESGAPLPFMLSRPVPNRAPEIWRLADLLVMHRR